MPRRSKLPPQIPAGFTPHDGTGCPVHPYSKPATFHRMGTKVMMGFRTAGELQDWQSDPWTWDASNPGPMDIVAYMDEPDEYVTVPRL